MKVDMGNGRIVEMTRAEFTRALTRSIGERYAREAGLRPGDSDAMMKLKIGVYCAVQRSKPQGTVPTEE